MPVRENISSVAKTNSVSDVKHLVYVWVELIKRQPKIFTAVVVFTVLMSIIPMIESLAVSKIIDLSIRRLANVNLDEILLYVGLFSLITLYTKFVDELKSYFEWRYRLGVNNAKDDFLFGGVLKAQPNTFEDHYYVLLRDKVNNMSWKINNGLSPVQNLMSSSVSGVVSLIIFSTIDLRIAVLAILAASLPVIVNFKFGDLVWGIWDHFGEEKTVYSTYKNTLYADDPQKVLEMKVFQYGRWLLDRSLEINQRFLDKLLPQARRRTFSLLASRLWDVGFISLGMFLIILKGLNGEISPGQMYFTFAMFNSLRSATSYLGVSISNILEDLSFYKAVHELLTYKPKVPIVSGKKKIDGTASFKIEFDDVSFKYPGSNKLVIKNCSFTISPDEDIAFVGENGAGKTTLTKLLLRIYDPTSGEIRINGINLKDLDLDSFYEKVGILSQNYFEFKFKAEEAIAIGKTSIPFDFERVVSAAKLSKADTFIEDFPNKYKTYLTTDMRSGVRPSGGQSQRIAIAKVFYRDPKLIILDEPTSAIDALAEEEIFSNLKDVSVNKNLFIISHRFATVKKADYIYVLEKGEIVERGNHTSLVAAGGLYSRMYSAQES